MREKRSRKGKAKKTVSFSAFRCHAPLRPSPRQLRAAAHALGPKVVAFCTKKLGRIVGNGECWTLAERALVAAAAEPPMMCALLSASHCYLESIRCVELHAVIADNFGTAVDLAEAQPGDVLQVSWHKKCVSFYSSSYLAAK
eukprot:SAG31_NODE_2163_length_6293_cov_2.483532_4_plen_142_part_00